MIVLMGKCLSSVSLFFFGKCLANSWVHNKLLVNERTYPRSAELSRYALSSRLFNFVTVLILLCSYSSTAAEMIPDDEKLPNRATTIYISMTPQDFEKKSSKAAMLKNVLSKRPFR